MSNSSHSPQKRLEPLVGWFTSLWAPVFGLIGALVFVYKFVKLWRSDWNTMSLVTTGALFCIVAAALYYFAFSRMSSLLQNGSQTFRYSPRIRKYAKGGLVVWLSLAVASIVTAGILAIRRDNREGSKVVLLVFNFQGPSPDHYR